MSLTVFNFFIFVGGFMFNMLYPRLRILRETYGVTQKEVAKYLDIDQRVYSTYELGKREIPVHFVIMLAKRYRVSSDYLLGLKDTD